MHKVLLTPTMGSIKPGLKGLGKKKRAHITLDDAFISRGKFPRMFGELAWEQKTFPTDLS